MEICKQPAAAHPFPVGEPLPNVTLRISTQRRQTYRCSPIGLFYFLEMIFAARPSLSGSGGRGRDVPMDDRGKQTGFQKRQSWIKLPEQKPIQHEAVLLWDIIMNARIMYLMRVAQADGASPNNVSAFR
jgi:hypothetical protein